MRNIVILTGAGLSADSGLATFRGPGGLWEGHRVEDVCTPAALARSPALVHRFYDARRAALATVTPNAAHRRNPPRPCNTTRSRLGRGGAHAASASMIVPSSLSAAGAAAGCGAIALRSGVSARAASTATPSPK